MHPSLNEISVMRSPVLTLQTVTTPPPQVDPAGQVEQVVEPAEEYYKKSTNSQQVLVPHKVRVEIA